MLYNKSTSYITEIKQTFKDMDLNPKKLANMGYKALQGLVKGFSTIDSIIRQPSSSASTSLTMFLYPPDNDPTRNLTKYADLISDQIKTSYFTSRYSYLSASFYLKVYGVLGSASDLQSIMPMFIGKAVTRTDSQTISVTLELCSDGTVFAIALARNSSMSPPKSSQDVAKGIDGNGKKADGVSVERTVMDVDGNFRPITVKFKELRNEQEYVVFYVSGLSVPREKLVSGNIWNVSAVPKDPAVTMKRILCGDEDEEDY